MKRYASSFIAVLLILIGSFTCYGREPIDEGDLKLDFEKTKNRMVEVLSGLVGKGELDNKLAQAIGQASLTMVKECLQQGAQVNANDKNGITPLMRASMNGCTQIAAALLEKGADINLKSAQSGFNALHFACLNGYPETAKLLLEKGPDINTPSKDGVTSLILAAFFGRVEVVKLLVAKGANINAVDGQGHNAAQWANAQGYPEIAQLLQSP